MSADTVNPERRPLRVLIIEDYEEDAFLLQRHLSRAGYAVHALRVELPEELYEALRHETPWDLVIADYTLPSFGARDALAMLQASGKDLPFIIVSGTIDEVSAVSAMRAGAHDYVLKGALDRLLPAIERELIDADKRRERLRTEQALQLAQRRFSATFNQAAVGMAHTTVEGRFALVNQRLTEMVGLTEAQLHTLRLEDFLLPSEQGSDATLLTELLAGSRSGFRVERTLMRSDGNTFPAQLTVSLLQHDGAASSPERSLLWVVEDISARRAAERETADLMTRLINSERLAAAGRMANTLAHEINNPLEALTNIVFLLKNSALQPDLQDLVEIASRELERVGHITRSTLSFYRKVPGRTLDLASLLREVLQLFSSRAAQQVVELSLRTAPELADLHYDPALRQVFANIIGNALEAMEGEGGRIVVRARQLGERAVVTIADSGHGIEAAHLSAIFEPFFTTKGERGTGLGLWVTRGILEEHGGTLQLRTSTRASCRGTTFRVTLPVPHAVESDISGVFEHASPATIPDRA